MHTPTLPDLPNWRIDNLRSTDKEVWPPDPFREIVVFIRFRFGGGGHFLMIRPVRSEVSDSHGPNVKASIAMSTTALGLRFERRYVNEENE